jgi:hypothetical protein
MVGASGPVLTGADVALVPARFVADPFVVRRDGTWYLFFELLNAVTGQGDIGLATSRDGKSWTYDRVVLDEPFHLSFPYVFEWQGAWYMLPEMARSGALTLYRAVEFPTRWEPHCQLLEGAYVDSLLLPHAGCWWLFTTPRGTKELQLFLSDTPCGPWTLHPGSPLIRNNGHITRGGGRMIVYQGTPLRFTQDVEPTYGNALRVFRITTLTATHYAEEAGAGAPLLSATGRGWRAWGMHHVDPVEVRSNLWQAVVDGVGPSFPDTPLDAVFANGVHLDGVSVRPRQVKAGGHVLLRYFLSGQPQSFPPGLAAFVHFGPRGERFVFQGDFGLIPGRDFYEALVEIPSNAPPGNYEMRFGLHVPETGQRVPLTSRWRKEDCRVRRVLRVDRP